MNPDDTIVAISSAAGAAVRGIVRLSGPAAVEAAESVFTIERARQPGAAATPPLAAMPLESSIPLASAVPTDSDMATEAGIQSRLMDITSNQMVTGQIHIGRHRVPGFALVFRAPCSYTRQDVVELHLIGAPVFLGTVVEAFLTSGVRRAEPGEFTLRAYLAGAMDLSQAHGVAGMIAARSDMQLRAAERLLHGDLSRAAAAAREALADLLSLVEGAMDFADEPIEFITPIELRERLSVVRSALAKTAAAGLRAERWDRLPQVVLTGRPNAGKSSLMNRLTGLDRAICAPVAGTTRDVLSAPLVLGDIECLLIDVAGIGEIAHELDRHAQDAALRALASADLVVQVFDASVPDGPLEPVTSCNHHTPVLRLGNKCDRLSNSESNDAQKRESAAARYDLLVSAKTGEGMESLKQRIHSELTQRACDTGDASIALMAEHRAALEAAVAALDRAIALASSSGDALEDAELTAAELRIAADELGVLAGCEETEDLLGRIFSRFCVGK